MHTPRIVRAPRGSQLSAKSWLTEAPLRMLMNNLDPEVAERPEELVVYGGIGKAARNWQCYDAIVAALTRLEADQTLLVQSGKAVGIVGILEPESFEPAGVDAGDAVRSQQAGQRVGREAGGAAGERTDMGTGVDDHRRRRAAALRLIA